MDQTFTGWISYAEFAEEFYETELHDQNTTPIEIPDAELPY